MKNNITSNSNRNDRIDRVSGVNDGYKNAKVRIVVANNQEQNHNLQVMAVVALNICGRWANNIIVNVSEDAPCVISKYAGRTLKSVMEELVAISNPTCNFSINSKESDGEIILLVGSSFPSGILEQKCIWINCDGWLAGCGYSNPAKQQPAANNRSVVGASFAACLGAAEVFRQAIGEKNIEFSRWYSLFDYGSANTPQDLSNPIFNSAAIDLGRIHQIGCGAIGSSFDFLLSLTEDIKASIDLIDHDHIEDHNLPGSLLFSEQDGQLGVEKAVACKEVFNNMVSSQAYSMDYETFIKNGIYNKNVPDVILCFANDKNIWSTVQYKCPPITFHATTSKTWGTNFGRHIPEKEWCLMCRFHAEIKQLTPLECSKGNISIDPQKEILGMLPFLAPASALITLAELYKLGTATSYPVSRNFIEFSMRRPSGKFIGIQRSAKECYVCQEQSLDTYPGYIKNTKYWHLTEKV